MEHQTKTGTAPDKHAAAIAALFSDAIKRALSEAFSDYDLHSIIEDAARRLIEEKSSEVVNKSISDMVADLERAQKDTTRLAVTAALRKYIVDPETLAAKPRKLELTGYIIGVIDMHNNRIAALTDADLFQTPSQTDEENHAAGPVTVYDSHFGACTELDKARELWNKRRDENGTFAPEVVVIPLVNL